MPSIGGMRDWILIQKKTVTSDGQGGKITKWQDFGETYCKIETLSLFVRTRFAQHQVDVSDLIKMREMDGLDENMRILLITDSEGEPTYYDVVSVEDDKKRQRFLNVMVLKQRAKQGKKRNR